MYRDDIKLFAKNEEELENLIQAERIYSEDIEIEFAIEKCAMLIMKSRKRLRTEEIEQPNQDKIRTSGEMETYKFWKRTPLHMRRWNGKKKKEYIKRIKKLLETEQKSHQNDKYLDCSPRKKLGTILKVNQRRTPMNEPENKKTHNDAQGLTS